MNKWLEYYRRELEVLKPRPLDYGSAIHTDYPIAMKLYNAMSTILSVVKTHNIDGLFGSNSVYMVLRCELIDMNERNNARVSR